MVTATQKLNPIKSSLWFDCAEQHTISGIKYTKNYGKADGISNIQLGDGNTASTIPYQLSPRGFDFVDGYYIPINLTLGTAWTISFTLSFNGGNNEYIIGFSTGGGVIVRDTAASNCLSYYDGISRISSTIELMRTRQYHICITKSSGNSVKIYIDGALKATGAGTVGNTILTRIGTDNSATNWYNGILIQFCAFKYEISANDVVTLFNRIKRSINGLNISSTLINPAGLVWKNGGFWIDPNWSNVLTINTQPTPDDWDMETIGVARWTPFLAARSKQGNAYSGAQCLRVEDTGSPGGAAYQSGKTINGNRYVASCVGRGDGVASSAKIALNSPGIGSPPSTTLNSWQTLSEEATADASGQIAVRYGSYAAGGYCEFDNLTIQNISINAINIRSSSSTLSGASFSQGTAANMPWKSTTLFNNRQPINNDGGCYLINNAAADIFSGVNTAFTVFAVIKQKTHPVASNKYWWSACDDGGTNRVDAGTQGPTGNLLAVRSSSLGGISAYSGSSGDTNLNVYAWVFNGSVLTIRRNGNTLVSNFVFTLVNPITPTKFLLNATINSSYAGDTYIGDFIALHGALSTSDVNSIGQSLANKWGITWV